MVLVIPQNQQILTQTQLDETINPACKRQNYRIGLNRLAIRKIQRGDPRVSIGHYVPYSVCWGLGLMENFAQVANDGELGRKLQDIKLMSKQKGRYS